MILASVVPRLAASAPPEGLLEMQLLRPSLPEADALGLLSGRLVEAARQAILVHRNVREPLPAALGDKPLWLVEIRHSVFSVLLHEEPGAAGLMSQTSGRMDEIIQKGRFFHWKQGRPCV